MKNDSLTIHLNATLRDALKKIECNQLGLILTTDDDNRICGLATDGDIRRRLLINPSLDSPISACHNVNFFWADKSVEREVLLKRLDHQIRLIPLLDSNRHLVDVITRDYLPESVEEKIYARSRAPVRVSFGGGGSDLTHFFTHENGAVINATISLYSHALLRVRADQKIIIHSLDLNEKISVTHLKELLSLKGNFTLIQAVLRTIQPRFGFELYLHSDFPIGSGLGGSAVVTAAILGCFNQFRHDKWDSHELAELAYQAERIYMGVAGGWQDQYATVFGGVNFMEFRMDQNLIHPLRLSADILHELEESLILCDTGLSHQSGNIHEDQKEQMQSDVIKEQVLENVKLTYKIRDHLLRGRLFDFGKLLNEAWQLKKQFSKKISNQRIDDLYSGALKNGAIGGKLLGAGGGGFFLFYVPPFKKYDLISFLRDQNFNIRQFNFEAEGLKSWTVRERNMV